MNIVFDFGGVLFRWRPHEFMARLLPHRAPDEAAAHALVAEFFESYEGDWGEFDRGMISAPHLARRIARRTGIALADVHRVIDAVPVELQPVPETVALATRLRDRGHRLFFLSNMPAPYADHLEATHEFLAAFDDGVFSSRVKLVKPDAAIFREAARRFRVEPTDTLFIDDHAPNIATARSLGWHALHFLSPEGCEADLCERGLV
ncbi:MAG: HAD family phosphatase [Betaproteobacteria bacterium]|nr:MAG: HAD family phosphatase [Betaproteobacteria bacterium]TMH30132.1 MAG: HAD family phosphatase [Betaproteobacteria bacterium]